MVDGVEGAGRIVKITKVSNIKHLTGEDNEKMARRKELTFCAGMLTLCCSNSVH